MLIVHLNAYYFGQISYIKNLYIFDVKLAEKISRYFFAKHLFRAQHDYFESTEKVE